MRADEPLTERASASTADRAAPADAPLVALRPVQTLRRRWPALLGAAVTVAMMVGLLHELLDHGLAGLRRTVPEAPGFYVYFLLSYLALPVCDFVIFRRLWGVPPGAFLALNKKRIANDILIGYSGDAYFYAWARARLKMVAAPFGAVKDVSIVSGIVGNLTAILLGAVALPLGYELIDPELVRTMLWSLGIALAVPVVVVAFSSRVFSLSRGDLWFIFGIDWLRITLTCVTIALAWSYAMPSVSIGMWLFLVAGRQLVSRLPLVPNKDLLFANFAILVIGHDRTLSDLMAFTGASTLVMHLLLTLLFGVVYVWERTQRWRHTGGA
ncbi:MULTISPECIES: hypothetical protein [unclassified Sphingomonas]|uniref:hypothetical protein n=1 Tax=unclassified Sphingomonas TaxID=196159 RepID=UPI0017C69890|nr:MULTISPECIES: hypothetical protein [unclassified Sphingomonas]MBB3347857.1 hypothetical protein [Sphingomonas sp. BK069]MBB3474066.1 hypothetical protein [Sphingomonas sp. BK345]